MAYAVADPYSTAVRSGLALTYLCDASYRGSLVSGATGLQPTGGSVTDTTKPGVRRTLSLELPGDRVMFDRLAPIGTVLTVKAVVQYTNRASATIPMGVFDVDSQTLAEGGGKLTLTAPDKWQRIVRAKFLHPTNSSPGATVVSQITSLVQGALGVSEPVNVFTASTARVGALTWQSDRAQAIIDLATSAGLWCYFDRSGGFTITNQPTLGKSADWLVDASASGVLVSLDRSRSRTNTYNVVSVTSSAAASEAFSPVWVWDNDVNSPTYAGSNDGTGKPNPATAGPFGQSVYNLSDPSIADAASAAVAGRAVLAKTVGLASQVSLTMSPNPAIDAWDVLDVLPPGPVTVVPILSGGTTTYPSSSTYPSASTYPGDHNGGTVTGVKMYPSGRITERHTVDTISHPLDVTQGPQIQGRSTRTDAYT